MTKVIDKRAKDYSVHTLVDLQQLLLSVDNSSIINRFGLKFIYFIIVRVLEIALLQFSE